MIIVLNKLMYFFLLFDFYLSLLKITISIFSQITQGFTLILINLFNINDTSKILFNVNLILRLNLITTA